MKTNPAFRSRQATEPAVDEHFGIRHTEFQDAAGAVWTMARALRTVRDGGHLPNAVCESWPAYVAAHAPHLSLRQANRLVQAAGVIDDLEARSLPMDDGTEMPMPVRESQVRPLLKLANGNDRAEVWRGACLERGDGKLPSARVVAKHVAAFLGVQPRSYPGAIRPRSKSPVLASDDPMLIALLDACRSGVLANILPLGRILEIQLGIPPGREHPGFRFKSPLPDYPARPSTAVARRVGKESGPLPARDAAAAPDELAGQADDWSPPVVEAKCA